MLPLRQVVVALAQSAELTPVLATAPPLPLPLPLPPLLFLVVGAVAVIARLVNQCHEES